MRARTTFAVACWVFGCGLIAGRSAAQERPTTVTAIAGVIAAGEQWQVAAVTFENADGVTASPDGSVLWASPPTSRVSGIDKNGQVKAFFEQTNGAGVIGFAPDGRVFAMMRDKTSNNGAAPFPAFGVIRPETKVLADNFQGDKFLGAGDLAVVKNGGVYFVESRRQPFPGIYYYSPKGVLTKAVDGIRANGIALSLDERTLYLTNGAAIVSLDVRPDGTLGAPKDFATLHDGADPDGLAIDSSGRVYAAADPGIQVFSPKGEFLGAIPAPRPLNSLCFGGPEKKWLFIVGNGAVDSAGKQFPGSPAKTIYKIATLAQGPTDRPK